LIGEGKRSSGAGSISISGTISGAPPGGWGGPSVRLAKREELAPRGRQEREVLKINKSLVLRTL
jgi:hypothetical protein